MKLPLFLIAGILAALPAVARADTDPLPFSQTLTPVERMQTGVARLAPAQVSALNAQVRRDEADAAAFSGKSTSAHATQFSQRLTTAERTQTGVALLNESEVTQLDRLVARTEADDIAARALTTESTAANLAVSPPRAPQIHGMISFMYGAGSGGYTAKGGAMLLNYDDPAHGFSVTVGYSQVRTTGPSPYFDCGYGPGFPYGTAFGPPWYFGR